MRIVMLLGALLLSACANCHRHPFWETVKFANQAQLNDRLAKGDDIRVTTRENKIYRFRVSGFESDALLGWGEDKRKYRIPREWVNQVEVLRDPGQRDPMCNFGNVPVTLYSTSP